MLKVPPALVFRVDTVKAPEAVLVLLVLFIFKIV